MYMKDFCSIVLNYSQADDGHHLYAVPATNRLFIRRVKESSSLSMSKYDIVID